MKNLLFLLLLCLSNLGFTQTTKLKAYLDTKQFYSLETGNYLEIHLQFVGASAKFVPVHNGIQASILIRFDIQNDKNELLTRDEYVLESPIAEDSIQDDFYEIERLSLPAGKYKLGIFLSDVNRENSTVSAQVDISIDEMGKGTQLSDIQIADYAYKTEKITNFYKSGYHIVPLISTFFPSTLNKIPAYFEVYNASKSGDTTVRILQKVINTETSRELLDYREVTNYSSKPMIPVFKILNIENIPSGNYELSYTVINSKQTELASRHYIFDRTNDLIEVITDENLVLDPAFQASIPEDSVDYYLESLIPIAKPAEIKNIIASLKTHSNEKCRKHIQAFWVFSAPKNSYEAWLAYKAQVQQVEKAYGNNFQEGFETDRGRVYLKYGTPSSVVAKENSPLEYPYEIWTYNKIKQFSNKRFIFYNPDLVNNAYRLLHSDMLGELKNPAWQQILVKRNTNNGDIDNPNKYNTETWGGNSNNYYRQY